MSPEREGRLLVVALIIAVLATATTPTDTSDLSCTRTAA